MRENELARRRRIDVLVGELRDMLHADPLLAARTGQALANGEMEELVMAQDTQIVLRAPNDLVERIDALIPTVEKDPELATFGRVTRSGVIRLALLRGLAALEEQYNGPGKKPKRKQ